MNNMPLIAKVISFMYSITAFILRLRDCSSEGIQAEHSNSPFNQAIMNCEHCEDIINELSANKIWLAGT